MSLDEDIHSGSINRNEFREHYDGYDDKPRAGLLLLLKRNISTTEAPTKGFFVTWDRLSHMRFDPGLQDSDGARVFVHGGLKMDRKFNLVLVTDCGGSDRGRYEIAAQRCFFPYQPSVTFFATESMNTLHCGFTAAAHGLSTIDHFGPLKEGERVGMLINAAPRHGTENGKKLRGENRKLDGEEVYALHFDNGVWGVGPNAGMNFYFLQHRVCESFLITDVSGRYTPFRSMEMMIPSLAKVLGAQDAPSLTLSPKELVVPEPDPGIFVADWDSHGNIYLVSTIPEEHWVPKLDDFTVLRIGGKIARLRHVSGIFAGNTGEQTLTHGSLRLNGKSVFYIVVVGGSAHSLFGSPPVGRRVEVERD